MEVKTKMGLYNELVHYINICQKYDEISKRNGKIFSGHSPNEETIMKKIEEKKKEIETKYSYLNSKLYSENIYEFLDFIKGKPYEKKILEGFNELHKNKTKNRINLLIKILCPILMVFFIIFGLASCYKGCIKDAGEGWEWSFVICSVLAFAFFILSIHFISNDDIPYNTSLDLVKKIIDNIQNEEMKKLNLELITELEIEKKIFKETLQSYDLIELEEESKDLSHEKSRCYSLLPQRLHSIKNLEQFLIIFLPKISSDLSDDEIINKLLYYNITENK